MEFNKKTLEMIEDDDISMWGEYADKISHSDSEFAEQIYQKILTVDGEHTTALSNYASFLQEQGRYKETKLIYNRLLHLEKDNSNLNFRYGTFCVEIGDFESADRQFIKFLDQEMLASERLMDKANELAEQSKFRSAEWYYRFMMKQIPEDPFIYNNYALLLADLGRFDEAEEFFKKALLENEELGSDVSVEFNYANLLFLLDRIEEAEWFYDKALIQDPSDLPVLNNYVLLLIRKGEFAKSESILKRILAINPADMVALQTYSNLLVRDGKFEEAIHSAQTLVNSYPDYAQAYFQLASVLAEADRLEAAVEMLQKSLELEPNSVESTTLLAVTYADMERYEESQAIFEAALVDNANDPMLRYHYAAMLFDWDKNEEALLWVSALIEQDPDHGEGLSLLGSILKNQGKIYEARTLFEKSLEKDPLNPDVWLQAALFFHDTKDYVESDKCFSEAAKLAPKDDQIIAEKTRCDAERSR